MGHKIVKQVTRPDYGQTPGEQFPYDHEFGEPVYWEYVIAETEDPPPKPEPKAAAGKTLHRP